jgi:hypothetical protein
MTNVHLQIRARTWPIALLIGTGMLALPIGRWLISGHFPTGSLIGWALGLALGSRFYSYRRQELSLHEGVLTGPQHRARERVQIRVDEIDAERSSKPLRFGNRIIWSKSGRVSILVAAIYYARRDRVQLLQALGL